MGKQEYTSKNTSIKTVNKIYTNKEYKRGSFILDYGGGKYDLNVNYMKQKGCNVLVYDPYNRSDQHNATILDVVNRKGVDYVVCSNVLNVIKEDDIIRDVLLKMAMIAKMRNSTVYITVYEGDKTGIGKETRNGWQRNRKLAYYIPYVESFFRIVNIKKGIIEAVVL